MINLKQQNVRFLFDYKDGILLWKNPSSSKVKVGQKAGYVGKDGYGVVKINNISYKLHKIVFLYHYGYIPECIDHINGNRSDNNIENLRESTRSQNNWNSIKPKTNTSGVKGVSWYKTYNKWVAKCKVFGKQYFLGYFHNIEDAESAVIEFRKNNHGEFANNGWKNDT